MKRLRIYLDASVVGGCLDEEFAEESLALINMGATRRFIFLVSDLLLEELANAPGEVKKIVSQLDDGLVEAVSMSEESAALRDAYIKAGVVGAKHANDAHHVAIATIAGADLIVSWNFKHIVHFDKIRLFNAVNLRESYPIIDIRSPMEVV